MTLAVTWWPSLSQLTKRRLMKISDRKAEAIFSITLSFCESGYCIYLATRSIPKLDFSLGAGSEGFLYVDRVTFLV
jgi:hypothetical protein